MMTFLQPNNIAYNLRSKQSLLPTSCPVVDQFAHCTETFKRSQLYCTIAGQASGVRTLIWQNTHQSKVLSNKTHVKAHLTFKWPIILILITILKVLNGITQFTTWLDVIIQWQVDRLSLILKLALCTVSSSTV